MERLKLLYSIIAGGCIGTGIWHLTWGEYLPGAIWLLCSVLWFVWVILWAVMFPPVHEEI